MMIIGPSIFSVSSELQQKQPIFTGLVCELAPYPHCYVLINFICFNDAAQSGERGLQRTTGLP